MHARRATRRGWTRGEDLPARDRGGGGLCPAPEPSAWKGLHYSSVRYIRKGAERARASGLGSQPHTHRDVREAASAQGRARKLERCRPCGCSRSARYAARFNRCPLGLSYANSPAVVHLCGAHFPAPTLTASLARPAQHNPHIFTLRAIKPSHFIQESPRCSASRLSRRWRAFRTSSACRQPRHLLRRAPRSTHRWVARAHMHMRGRASD
jgi:hypothetical protein